MLHDLIAIALFVVVWYLINKYFLPWLGVST